MCFLRPIQVAVICNISPLVPFTVGNGFWLVVLCSEFARCPTTSKRLALRIPQPRAMARQNCIFMNNLTFVGPAACSALTGYLDLDLGFTAMGLVPSVHGLILTALFLSLTLYRQ
jgi:hypothetical protein